MKVKLSRASVSRQSAQKSQSRSSSIAAIQLVQFPVSRHLIWIASMVGVRSWFWLTNMNAQIGKSKPRI
jgi:hypothetical protein